VQLLRGFVSERGYLTRLYVGSTPPAGGESVDAPTSADFWSDLHADRLLGLVVVGTSLTAKLTEPVKARLVPLVSDCGLGPDGGMCDPREMVSAGTRYLIEQGCTRPAFIGWGTPEEPTDEFAAFVEELRRGGLAPRREWLRMVAGQDRFEAGLRAFTEIWKSGKRPDSLVIVDEVLYHGLVPGIIRRRIAVPDELHIITRATRGDPRPLLLPVALMEVDPEAAARFLGDEVIGRITGASPRERACPPSFTIVSADEVAGRVVPI
jgi:DNA-binding LacI/PurR family transcriptional regulator